MSSAMMDVCNCVVLELVSVMLFKSLLMFVLESRVWTDFCQFSAHHSVVYLCTRLSVCILCSMSCVRRVTEMCCLMRPWISVVKMGILLASNALKYQLLKN